MHSAVLKAMRKVQEKTAAFKSAKGSAKETAEAELSLTQAELERALAASPQAKQTYKKKTTTVEEEEDDGDDGDDGDDEDDEEEEEKASSKSEKMPPSDEESEEEESSDEEEEAAASAVKAARAKLSASVSDKAKARAHAALSAAKQHLAAVREKATAQARRDVRALKVEVAQLTSALQGTAKVAASNRRLKARIEACERFIALANIGQPDPTKPVGEGSAEVSEDQAKIWSGLGFQPSEFPKLLSAQRAHAAILARVTGKGN